MLFRRKILKRSEERKIVSAIKKAEKNTSGEIRVHVETECEGGDPIARAIFIFNAIGMFNTVQRNGVLIYVSLKSRMFAIIGDVGINNVIPENFWDSIKEKMKKNFISGEIIGGIETAVLETGELLKEKFPYQTDDVNEQPDEISYGK